MRRDYFGIVLALGALLACKNVAKELLKEDAPATPAPVAAPPAAATPAATTATTATTAATAAAVASAAPAASETAATAGGVPFDGKYAVGTISPIPANCAASRAILTTVTRGAFDSENFEWNFPKQVFLANPQFKLTTLGLPKAGDKVLLRALEHKPTKGVALIADCNLADTCMQVAAAYKTVVPTSHPEVVCGKSPSLGAELSMSPLLSVEGIAKESLPKKDNVIQQCVRLASCQARHDGKLEGDPAIECQRRPSSFQLRCSLKASCDEVLACVSKAAGKTP
jgi:hypothetical protein